MSIRVCRVDVWQEPDESLGISIVGGRTLIKRLRNGEELKGIFIKQVLPGSPAGRSAALKTGDKILQVAHPSGVAWGSSVDLCHIHSYSVTFLVLYFFRLL